MAPCSPDLTSPDFFLWGYIKNVVFAERLTREVLIGEPAQPSLEKLC